MSARLTIAPVVVDERGGQRQYGVFHPEALDARLFEHEQHTFGLRHLGTHHEADLALLRCCSDLNLDTVDTGRKLFAWQVELRRGLCHCMTAFQHGHHASDRSNVS